MDGWELVGGTLLASFALSVLGLCFQKKRVPPTTLRSAITQTAVEEEHVPTEKTQKTATLTSTVVSDERLTTTRTAPTSPVNTLADVPLSQESFAHGPRKPDVSAAPSTLPSHVGSRNSDNNLSRNPPKRNTDSKHSDDRPSVDACPQPPLVHAPPFAPAQLQAPGQPPLNESKISKRPPAAAASAEKPHSAIIRQSDEPISRMPSSQYLGQA